MTEAISLSKKSKSTELSAANPENDGNEDGDEEDHEPPRWHKYLGPFAAILRFAGKRNKMKTGKDWKKLREERVAAELAAAADDERLKLEKKEARRLEEAMKIVDENKEGIEDNGAFGGKSEKEDGEEVDASSVALTSVVRGFIARRRYKKKFEEAVHANVSFYGSEKQEIIFKKQALTNRRRGMVAANVFFRQYVVDLIDASAMYLVQTVAATTLQKNFRGAMCRAKVNYKPPPPRPKKQPPTRFTPQTIRRVWARSEFTPAAGWPGRALGVVEYDFREYEDRPPRGSNFGIKTPKVHTNVSNQEEMNILVDNQYAWVGLPILVEPKVVQQRRRLRKKQNLMLLEGASPFVGPQFAAPVIPPSKAERGVKAIKGLGWRKDMEDNRKVMRGDGKRAYHIIDPYSSASLAADLATVVSAAGYKPDNRNGIIKNNSVHLGSSLEDQSVGSLTTMESIHGGDHTSPHRSILGVGMGVWKGSVGDHSQVPTSHDEKHFSESTYTSMDANVIQLITPTRGYVKPLSEHRKLALSQKGLLPEQLEETYELQQRRTLIDHSKTTIFEQHAKEKKVDKIRMRVQFKRARLGKVKTHSDQKFMDDAHLWKKSANYRLMEGAGKLALEIRNHEESEMQESDDPWSRSTYTPKKEYNSKVVVWKKKPAEYYNYKYSWLPQPMLKKSVLSVYPEKMKTTPHNDRIEASLGDDESSLSTKLTNVSLVRSKNSESHKIKGDVSSRKGGIKGAKILPKGAVNQPYPMH